MSVRNFVSYSLKRGMILSVAVPLLFACLVSAFLLVNQWHQYRDARQMVQLKDLISAMGALVHEQQKERGATSVFLNSKGAEFASELAAQRLLTDRAAAVSRGSRRSRYPNARGSWSLHRAQCPDACSNKPDRFIGTKP